VWRKMSRVWRKSRFLICTVGVGTLLPGRWSASPYEALSYSWDGQTPENDIIFDGLNVGVTPNCAAAL
jgi:hypothetical protein